MNFKKSLITLTLSSALFACGEKTLEDHLSTAEQKLANNEHNAAVIELKNAVKLEPNNSEVRYLLAQAYLKTSQLKAAEKELSVALKNGHDVNLILPDLAFVYSLIQNNDATLDMTLDNLTLTESSKSKISFFKALAAFRTNDINQSNTFFDDAVKFDKTGLYSQLASLYRYDNLKDALPVVAEMLEQSPDFFHALFFQGIVSQDIGQKSLAVESFKKIDDLMPYYFTNYLYLANAYVQNNQFDEAQPYIDRYLRIDKNQAFANQLKAIVLYHQKDLQQAQFHLDKAMQLGLNTNSNRLLAGVVAYEQQRYEQAHAYLSTVVGQLNEDHPALKVFFATQLKLGYLDEAKSLLNDSLKGTSGHGELASSLSYELMKDGDVDGSKALLSTIDSDSDSSLNTKLGILKLSLDDMSGLENLIDARDADPSNIRATQALVATHIKNGELDKAMDAVHAFQKDNPELANGYILEGLLLSRSNKLDDALSALNKALEKDDQDQTALFYKSSIYLQQNNIDQAVASVDKLLEINKDSLQGLSLNYAIANYAETNTDDAIELINDAALRNSSMMIYKESLLRALITDKQFARVVQQVNRYKNDNIELSPRMWQTLVQAHAGLSDNRAVLRSLEDWAETSKTDLRAWNFYTEALMRSNDFDSAAEALKKAMYLNNDNPQLRVRLVSLLIGSGKINSAQNQLNKLPDDIKQVPLVQLSQARIFMATSKYDEALGLLKPLYENYQDSQIASLIYVAHASKKENKLARSFAKEHVTNHPEQLSMRMLLANSVIQADPNEAIVQYKYIVSKNNKNSTALNNLAYLLKEQGQLQDAKKYIEQALAVSPDNASILDTAGVIYIALNDKTNAVKALDKALKLDPTNQSYLDSLVKAKNM